MRGRKRSGPRFIGFAPRYPVVRQCDRVDCGPACLLAVLRFHGGDAALAPVRALAGTDASGTSLLGLYKAAEALGFDARGAPGDYESLGSVRLPCIAHFVVAAGAPPLCPSRPFMWATRLRIVEKFVRVPPSHLWFT